MFGARKKTFAQKSGGQPGRISVRVRNGPALYRLDWKVRLYCQTTYICTNCYHYWYIQYRNITHLWFLISLFPGLSWLCRWYLFPSGVQNQLDALVVFFDIWTYQVDMYYITRFLLSNYIDQNMSIWSWTIYEMLIYITCYMINVR